MFSDAVPVQAYIKYQIAQHVISLTPTDLLDARGLDLSNGQMRRIAPTGWRV
jgi:hypothetical protein